MRIDYDEFKITCDNVPSKEALIDYYSLLIDALNNKYGEEVLVALDLLVLDVRL